MRRNIIFLSLIGIILIGFIPVMAQVTLTWMGNSSRPTTWDYPANWDGGWVPSQDNNVLIPTGLTHYPSLTFSEQNCRNITIQSGAQLNVAVGGTAVLNVAGNWQNQGTFTSGSGTVRLVSTSSCSLSAETFNRLENNKYTITPFGVVTGTATMLGDISIRDQLTFQYAVLDAGTYNLNGIGTTNRLLLNTGQLKWGRETFTTTFETVNFDSGTVYFSRLGNQTIPSMYDYFKLYTSGTGTKTPDGNLHVMSDLNIGTGTSLQMGGNDLRLGGNCFINGAYYMGDDSQLLMNGGTLQVNAHGIFSAIGTSLARTGPIISRPGTSTSYYIFSVAGDSAIISASYATFEYMQWEGVNIAATAYIDPAHPLDHCRFQNGEISSYSSTLLMVSNSQEIEIPNADFPVMCNFNIYKGNDAGRVTFVDATGAYAGPTYEFDPYSRVDWVPSPPPVPPVVTISRESNSADLIWNTVSQNTGGNPIVVSQYKVFSDTSPFGLFNQLEATVVAPDTEWTDTDIINSQAIKFYRVTAVRN
jgi:hypothetical protein